MISNACTIGMPADIMVASWRANTAMSIGVTLPPERNAVLGVLTRVAATPWRRKSARKVASLAASDLPRTLLPRLSLPSQRNWVSFFPAVVAVAINPILTLNKLVDSDAIDFFQAGYAVFHLLQTGTPQIPNAVLGSLVTD